VEENGTSFGRKMENYYRSRVGHRLEKNVEPCEFGAPVASIEVPVSGAAA